MTPISPEKADAVIASYRADVDRYRDRARSFATLLATAAGALSAGLVFSVVGQSFETATRVTGYIGVLLLSLSICIFLSGSVFRVKNVSDSATATQTSPQALLDVATQNAKSAAETINSRIRTGSVIALTGLVALVAMLPLGAIFPDRPLPVTVHLVDIAPNDFPLCPMADGIIQGSASKASLASNSTLIPITVEARECDSDGDPRTRILHLNRSKIVISVLETK